MPGYCLAVVRRLQRNRSGQSCPPACNIGGFLPSRL